MEKLTSNKCPAVAYAPKLCQIRNYLKAAGQNFVVSRNSDSKARIASVFFAALGITLLMSSCCQCNANQQFSGYIDAHSHSSGVLPYYAYADLNTFVDHPGDPTKIDIKQRCNLWRKIVDVIEEKKGADWEKNGWVHVGPGNRLGPGAAATIEMYRNIDCDQPDRFAKQINGALERTLTTTPWTEFDSAYAIRGDAVEEYLKELYPRDSRKGLTLDATPLCDATIFQLAQTKNLYSEQFLSFIGGWKFDSEGHSGKLDYIRCFVRRPELLAMDGRFQTLGISKPSIKVLLMTSTSELGSTADGKHWLQFAETGQCAPTETALLKTSPEDIRNALLGRDFYGTKIIQKEEEGAFLDGVIGIDTAGPEFTCFTSTRDGNGVGMENFKRLARAVYSASRERRRGGWHGKLLIHTHVGEGAIAYAIDRPKQRASQKLNKPHASQFKKTKLATEETRAIFQKFPDMGKDPDTSKQVREFQARKNIEILIQAVREFRSEITDVDDYVVFRFGHVTQATLQNARDMKDLKIEADINLESNIATRAYLTPANILPTRKLSEDEQFEYNDLAAKAFAQVDPAILLSGHSLKFMLEAGVRTMLGTDGAGEEHSDIAKEYELAKNLIEYWKKNDSDFQKLVPVNLSIKIIYQNGNAHLRDLKEDKKVD